MEGFQSLKRSMAFHPVGTGTSPRITPSQWGVLMVIEARGDCTVKDVAETLSITSSAATQLVDGLVTSGYVMRDEYAEDRRRVTLALSPKTRTQVEKMKKQFSTQCLVMFEALDDEEFDQFMLLYNKIIERHSKRKEM